MGIIFRLEPFVFVANPGRKTAIFDAVCRPEQVGNDISLPDVLKALKRDIFLIAENGAGDLSLAPFLNIRLSIRCFCGQLLVNKAASDYFFDHRKIKNNQRNPHYNAG